MSIRIIACLVLFMIGHNLLAQQQPAEDFVSERADKKSYHYFGLQANQLIRQILSFGGNPGGVNNPYLITYSANNKQSGVGFATGLGLSSIQTKTSDVFGNTVSKINDVAWRVGVEKKSYLSKRWMAGWGVDILVESNKAETTSNNGSTPPPKVTTTTSRYGFGPRLTFNYQFHDKLLIGTEASFYLKWIKEKQTITGFTGTPAPDTDLKQFNFILPAVVFLMFKL